jgi:hypothetical protein
LGIMSKLGYEKCGEIDYHERGMRIAFEKLLFGSWDNRVV